MTRTSKRSKTKLTRRPPRAVTAPEGFRAAGVCCGLKPSGQSDLALIIADESCPAAGVFTTSTIPGSPIKVAKKHLKTGMTDNIRGGIRGIVCNSGNANVCTGRKGTDHAVEMCRQVGKLIHARPEQILPCSTGVIGVELPIGKVQHGIELAAAGLARGPRADQAVAKAILTTDLVSKTGYRMVKVGRSAVSIGGMAKGSGMIAPNMATMLCFITTDADIRPAPLARALVQAVAVSFNRISVDHDMSTSDAVLILASGRRGPPLAAASPAYRKFCAALTDLCRDLAYQIVQDGEGAAKVIRIAVSGARSQADAEKIGRTVAGSPLIKTAVHGGDPNWGRLVMAVGRSGAAVVPDKLALRIGRTSVCRRGQGLKLTVQARRSLHTHMKGKEIQLGIEVGLGKAKTEWLTCDLSKEYVNINADYTT